MDRDIMKKCIAISGTTGLIGSSLAQYYTREGWQVRKLGRADFLSSDAEMASILEGCSVVINLAGSPIIQRWTGANRRKILSSRIDTTRKLVDAFRRMNIAPDLFLNASAIGIYPTSGKHSETSQERDGGFLGEVCQAWEAEARRARSSTRLVMMRFGLILSTEKGALAKLLPLFKLGLGGKLGSGKQAFSWIHIKDLIAAVDFIIRDEKLDGPINFTAPESVTNKAFTQQLASQLKRPAILPVPSFALRMLYGAAADTLLKGQDVYPERLLEEGFAFRYPLLDEALKDLLSSD